MKKIINIVIPLIVITLVTFFSYKTYSASSQLESVNKSYYEAQSDIGELIKRKFDSILSTITLGMVENKDKEKVDINKLKAKQIVLKEESTKWIGYLGATVGLSLLFYFILSLTSFAFMSASISIITLIFGIITPILMIVIHKDVKYLGDIVLSFESKTIVATINHLYHNGNYPVAIVILLFSIVVPFIKSFSMLAVLFWRELHIAKKMVALFKHLGKWSMLDVFVVSLLLVYLSAGSSENSYSQIQNGTYIFLIYVVMSIITSISVEKVLKSK
jgi:hypothetical protein